jgi:hypothetical protein
MTNPEPRIRAMKARRKSTCRCGRLIQVGNRIIQLDGRWVCIDCALTAAGYPRPDQKRTTP